MDMEEKPKKSRKVEKIEEETYTKELDVPRTNENTKETKSAHQYLTYDVLRIIFRELNGRDLSNAALVCRTWLEAANNERRTRGPFCCLEPTNVWYHPNDHPKLRVMEKLPVKPVLSFFVSSQACEEENERKLTACHCRFLPSNCHNVTLNTVGVVLETTEIEENRSNLLSMFLPDSPGLRTKSFIMEKDYLMNVNTETAVDKYTKEIKEFYQRYSKNTKFSNCLLLFCEEFGRRVTSRILSSIKKSYPGDMLAVWGGVASHSLSACSPEIRKKNKCQSRAVVVAIGITGAPLLAWSIIVDRTYTTKEQVEQRLIVLKHRVRLKKYAIGLMFACCERGEGLYEETNVESKTFKALFPDVPLIGCFGDGEFGENTIPLEASKRKTHLYNESSTIFMIITYD